MDVGRTFSPKSSHQLLLLFFGKEGERAKLNKRKQNNDRDREYVRWEKMTLTHAKGRIMLIILL